MLSNSDIMLMLIIAQFTVAAVGISVEVIKYIWR